MFNRPGSENLDFLIVFFEDVFCIQFLIHHLYFKKIPSNCQLCGKETKVVWDHDHNTEKFRGWF